jgi:hypothetical protein
MTTTTITNIGYTGTIQNADVLGEYGIPVNAYLWGGGGGSTSIAAGNAGGYSKVYFVAKPGDRLTVAIGQGGGRGGTNINGWTPSGLPGAAYSGLLFNTRFPPAGQDTPVVPYGQGLRNTSSNSTSFLSQWGVWGADQNVQTFTRTYTVNFPATANVIFQMVASTYGRVYLDGTLIVEGAGRSGSNNDDTINQAFVKVTAGSHTITIEADGKGTPANPADGNPNAIGVIFGTGDQTTFAGGRGGQTSPPDVGTQGSAGGGAGATILSLNGVIIGVAAGGAGAATRLSNNTSTDFRYNNGQDGQDLNTIPNVYGSQAGGGGGGGGGLSAGQGGTAGYSAPTTGGAAGTNGTSLGDDKAQPVGQTPYTNSYYPGGGVAEGGTSGTPIDGGNGAIVLEFTTGGGGYIKDGGDWEQIQTTYVKNAGVWAPVQTTYINVNGIWKPTQGAPVPTFTQFNGAFAPSNRSFGARLTAPPPPPAPDYGGGGGFTGYGNNDIF